MIISVAGFTNCSAFMLKEMVMPRSRVIRLASSFCAVWLRLSQHAAFPQQVAEHEEAHQGHGLG